jgi:cation diffusion facilitator CzcD-associated flavoprotein CzcO
MTEHSELLVVGAGPYGVSTAARARDRGISTTIVGRPMAFWREQMPADMLLRSGRDWHLDGSEEHTFAAYFADRGIGPAAYDPIPIGVFLDYTEWFLAKKGLEVDRRLVDTLTETDGRFEALLSDGSRVTADKVVAAPGIGQFAHLPDWAEDVPADRRSHTSDLVDFDRFSGSRLAVIGGRQSAYEWAALLCDQGASRVDVVHRHGAPRFDRSSWGFVDAYVDLTEKHRGWWRELSSQARQAISLRFWRVGRLTLEPWLVPRLTRDVVTVHERAQVTTCKVTDGGVSLQVSDGSVVEADHVVFASGYRADLAAVPYLEGVLDRITLTKGFPVLSPGMETSLPGLFVTGFAATRDFGPFYGFTKGCPSAARIMVEEILNPPAPS